MNFRMDSVDAFLAIFENSKEKIRSFHGCQHLQLLADANASNVFSTYSIWENEEHLNDYRDSELFGQVWPETKKLFSKPPVAHSYHQKIKLD